MFKKGLLYVGAAIAALYSSLYLLQDKLIYLPRAYHPMLLKHLRVVSPTSASSSSSSASTSTSTSTSTYTSPFHLQQIQFNDPLSGTMNAFLYTWKTDTSSTEKIDKIDNTDHKTLDKIALPDKIIVVTGGNAALALDWLDVAESILVTSSTSTSASTSSTSNQNKIAVLLIDYPGYGLNKHHQAAPSPQTIVSTIHSALHYIGTSIYQLPVEETVESSTSTSTQSSSSSSSSSIYTHLYPRLHFLSHSLGCAASLHFAARYLCQQSHSHSHSHSHTHSYTHKFVLVSPFTTMLDMTKVVVGRLPGIDLLLQHKYDNIQAVNQLLQNATKNNFKLEFTIIHGQQDEIVPYQHAQTLTQTIQQTIQQSSESASAASNTHSVDLVTVENGDHNSLFSIPWIRRMIDQRLGK